MMLRFRWCLRVGVYRPPVENRLLPEVCWTGASGPWRPPASSRPPRGWSGRSRDDPARTGGDRTTRTDADRSCAGRSGPCGRSPAGGALARALRLEAGRCPGDRRLADLIGELTRNSPEFGTWWNDHRILRHTHGTTHCRHPLVGDLHFSYEFMQLPGDDNQTLCVYLPQPDSTTAQSLSILNSWNASTTDTAPDPRPSGPGS